MELFSEQEKKETCSESELVLNEAEIEIFYFISTLFALFLYIRHAWNDKTTAHENKEGDKSYFEVEQCLVDMQTHKTQLTPECLIC